MRSLRLGDDIDDFCIKCKRLTNHSIVSLVEEQPGKVRCRTCYFDHDYLKEQAPPKKVTPKKAATKKTATIEPEGETT
ncbi:MAG: hypothetical protein GY953_41935 [bacterium]|nr:hypothetical protein [bacterium]